MTYQELNASNLQDVFKFPSLDTPMFYPILLFGIFVIFALGSFFREIAREGKGSILSSLAVASFVTTAITLVMTFMGIIQKEIMIIVLVICAVFITLFLVSGRD